jgi:hypothetical protein
MDDLASLDATTMFDDALVAVGEVPRTARSRACRSC